MKSVRWPTGLADAGALACAGLLFAAVALEVPARAESRPSGLPIAASASATPALSQLAMPTTPHLAAPTR
jgi:hypothetical protein